MYNTDLGNKKETMQIKTALANKQAIDLNLLVPQNYPFNTGSKQNHTRYVWRKAVKKCFAENARL